MGSKLQNSLVDGVRKARRVIVFITASLATLTISHPHSALAGDDALIDWPGVLRATSALFNMESSGQITLSVDGRTIGLSGLSSGKPRLVNRGTGAVEFEFRDGETPIQFTPSARALIASSSTPSLIVFNQKMLFTEERPTPFQAKALSVNPLNGHVFISSIPTILASYGNQISQVMGVDGEIYHEFDSSKSGFHLIDFIPGSEDLLAFNFSTGDAFRVKPQGAVVQSRRVITEDISNLKDISATVWRGFLCLHYTTRDTSEIVHTFYQLSEGRILSFRIPFDDRYVIDYRPANNGVLEINTKMDQVVTYSFIDIDNRRKIRAQGYHAPATAPTYAFSGSILIYEANIDGTVYAADVTSGQVYGSRMSPFVIRDQNGMAVVAHFRFLDDTTLFVDGLGRSQIYSFIK